MNRDEYQAYLRSPHWQAVRRRYWASRMPKNCAVCGRSDVPRDLHHRSYKRIGKERLHDLVPLCRPCHEETHKYAAERKAKKVKMALWGAHLTTARKKRKEAKQATMRREHGTNPRALGDNPRARGENPRAKQKG